MFFMKSEHMITQAVALSSPVSTVYTRNAQDHDPTFGDQEGLAFYLGFPTEARGKYLATFTYNKNKFQNSVVFSFYNLGQNKWNTWTTPPPHFNDAKMARFCSFAPSSLLWGGRALIVPFYSVQDCPRFILV